MRLGLCVKLGLLFLTSNRKFIKKNKGATQVYKKYTINTPNQKKKKKKKKKKIKKIIKARNIKVVKASSPVPKFIEEKKYLIPPPSSCAFQKFDNFFPSKDTRLGRTEPSSTLLNSEDYQSALSNMGMGLYHLFKYNPS
jgi:hypothetical protein